MISSKRGMNNFVDATGMRFGRLRVLERIRSGRGWKWRCVCDCGNEAKTVYHKLVTGHTSSCGCYRNERAKAKRGELRYNWNGGKSLDNGYVRFLMPDHQRANCRGYVYEHIVVMEKKLGRSLIDNENVHHINGNRSDNRPENLELWSTKQPKGQRVEDKVTWAIEIVSQYASLEQVKALLKSIGDRSA